MLIIYIFPKQNYIKEYKNLQLNPNTLFSDIAFYDRQDLSKKQVPYDLKQDLKVVSEKGTLGSSLAFAFSIQVIWSEHCKAW